MDLSTREGRRILGDRIKRAAKEAGLSLDDLAARIACSRALIYQYASGASLAQPDRLQQIAAVVNKPLAWFFEDDHASHKAEIPNPAPNSAPGTPHSQLRYLRELIDAYSSPPDWRRVADTCQQLIAVIQVDDGVGLSNASADVAQYLFIHGNALSRLQEFGNAKNKLEEAAGMYRELGMTPETLDCLQSIGSADVHLGRTTEAMATFKKVAAGVEWHHRWQGTLSIGAVQEMLGDYTAASETLLRAQEVIGEHQDVNATTAAYLYVDGNWTNLELAWADYERALETALRCVASAQKLGDQDQYIEALLNCAAARLGLGQFAEAVRDADAAVNVAELVRDHERWSLGLATRSLATGWVVDAVEALSIALRYNCRRAELVAQRAIATACLNNGNLVEARYHIDQALATAEAGNLKVPLLEFRVLSATVAHAAARTAAGSNGPVAPARPELRARAPRDLAAACLADAALLQVKQPQHDAALLLAEIAQDGVQWDEALAHASTAATLARQMGSDWLLWRSESIRGAALMATGTVDEAGQAIESAVQSVDKHRNVLRQAFGHDTLPDVDGVKEVWLQWFSYLESVGRESDALEFVEQSNWEPLAAWIEEQRNVPN